MNIYFILIVASWPVVGFFGDILFNYRNKMVVTISEMFWSVLFGYLTLLFSLIDCFLDFTFYLSLKIKSFNWDIVIFDFRKIK